MEALQDAAENGDDEGEDEGEGDRPDDGDLDDEGDRSAEDESEGDRPDDGDLDSDDEGDRSAEDESEGDRPGGDGDRNSEDEGEGGRADDGDRNSEDEGEGGRADDGDRSGGDHDEDDEASDFDDATTLVLGESPPSLFSDDEKDNMELQSTDNESRSPWEKTGVTKANKLLKRKMLKEGKPWPPSPRHCPLERAQPSDDDDDDSTPNVPSSSTGAEVMMALAGVPRDTDENYVTPPKRLASTRLDGSTQKTMRTEKGKVMMDGVGATVASRLVLVVLVGGWAKSIPSISSY